MFLVLLARMHADRVPYGFNKKMIIYSDLIFCVGFFH